MNGDPGVEQPSNARQRAAQPPASAAALCHAPTSIMAAFEVVGWVAVRNPLLAPYLRYISLNMYVRGDPISEWHFCLCDVSFVSFRTLFETATNTHTPFVQFALCFPLRHPSIVTRCENVCLLHIFVSTAHGQFNSIKLFCAARRIPNCRVCKCVCWLVLRLHFANKIYPVRLWLCVKWISSIKSTRERQRPTYGASHSA